MLSAADRARWRIQREQLDSDLIGALDQTLLVLEGTTDPQMRDMVFGAIPDIVSAHGELNGQLTAEFYRLARIAAGLPDDFMPTTEFVVPREAIARSAQWALDRRDSQAAADWLRASMLRHARRAEAFAVLRGTRDDPAGARMRRVPQAGSCPWCMMLATRGYAYSSDTVLLTAEGSKYHDRCKCTSEPQFSGEPNPPFLDRLEQAWKANPSMDKFAEFVESGGLGDREPKGPPGKPGRPPKADTAA